ncbi:MAG TPA: hypothetical protein VGL22_15200 [Terracidiphilus sp.]|jgi:hypothetical protein
MSPNLISTTDQAPTIQFHQASPPALPPGDYSLNVTQNLTAPGVTQPYGTVAPFTVAGPRFYLKPEEVYSVYPPPDFGPFDNALPHIVFTRRTLPWERTIQGNFTRQDPDLPVPWMALLLLSRDDFADGTIPAVKSRTVDGLLNPEGGVQGPQGLILERGQTLNDLCNTIDIPGALFAEIVPTKDDLPYLAHVREVSLAGKETLSLKQDGWFTVVLGNRLALARKDPANPNPSIKPEGEINLVCLVSLEGFAELLPKVDGNGNATSPIPGDKSAVRLAVLASWKFTCYGNNDFKTKMAALDDETLLGLPTKDLKGTDDGTVFALSALTLGYAGLNHTTRLGEKTVSWYRGPLVPLEMKVLDPYEAIPCADHALRYDPRNGMFAAEYAAAFELGRMMALNNRSFARAMQRYRNRVAQDVAAEARQKQLDAQFGQSDDFAGAVVQLIGNAGASGE